MNIFTATRCIGAIMELMHNLPSITYNSTHGHAAFLYETPSEKWATLGKYFAEGLDVNELCVLVTPESPQDVLKEFKIHGYDLEAAVASQALRIFEMQSTYLPSGKFVADYMLSNVQGFQKEATELGFSGLRTAGEMEWLYDHPEAADEASRYEAAVNDESVATENFVGLCLYPIKDHFTKILHDVGRTHPSIIYDGKIAASTSFSGQN